MRREKTNSLQDDRYGHLITSRRWLAVRRRQLTDHPLCERCREKSILTPATCVHHVVPVESGGTMEAMAALCYNPANLQSLCQKCHNEIHTEMGSRSRQKQKRRHEAELEAFKNRFL